MSRRPWAARAALALAACFFAQDTEAQQQAPGSRMPSSHSPCAAGQTPLEILLPTRAAGAYARVESAAPAPEPSAATPAEPEVLHALADAICDWFHGDRWSVSFPPHAAHAEPALRSGLRVAVELPSLERARLHLVTPEGRWVHDVPLGSGLDDAGIEAIAEALHSAAQAASAEPSAPRASRSTPPPSSAARSNARAAITRLPPASRVAGSPGAPTSHDGPASQATRSVERVTLGGRHLPVHTALGYQGYARGPEPFMHGPVMHVELDAVSRPVALAVYARAALFTSATRRASRFAVHSSGVSLSLGAAASLPIGAISARAAASGGVDLVALDVRVIEPELARSLPGRDVAPRPFTGVEAGVRWRLGPVELALDALSRLLWLDTHYQVLDGSTTRTVFRPWRLQPGALLELGYVW
jgi:hypothetical protein